MTEAERERMLMYPNTPLGEQKRPFENAFSGFAMLRSLFARRLDHHKEDSKHG